MVRVSRLVAVVVVVAGTALAASSCKKAELGDPTPTGITVAVDASSITADDGSVIVRAQVFEDGVALLGESVTFSIDGTLAQSAVIVPTDPTTGIAEHTFANLRTVGSGNVIVSAGDATAPVTASAPLSVTPGVPAAVSVDAGGTASADQGSTTIAVTATDAFANAVPAAPINLSTNAPGAIIVQDSLQNLRVAGSWQLVASLAGYPAVLATDGYIVTAGAAQQAKASLGQSVVGTLQTLDVYCEEQDQYGNPTGAPYTATTQVFTTPSSTITSLGDGHFTASGFTVTGPATAHCDKGAIEDLKTFQIVAQSATNTVVANLDRSVVEAGMTATLTCAELDPFGNDTGTVFGLGDVSTTAGASIVSAGGNTFTLSNLLSKGTFTATCNSMTAGSDSDDFAVVDTTAPVITGFAITGATPHNGPLDGHHGPNEELTITLSATDAVGLSRAEISGPGAGFTTANPVFFPAATTAAGPTFTFRVDPNAPTFSTVTLRGQAADTTGNTTTFAADLVVTVDPGAGIAVAAPSTVIRTHWEHSSLAGTAAGIIPRAVLSSGSVLYLTDTSSMVDVDEIRRIAGTGFTSDVVASNFVVSGLDLLDQGFVHVPGDFGGRNLFHSIVGDIGSIGALASGSPVTHTPGPLAPRDLSYGTVDAQTSLFVFENGSVPNRILRVDAAGVTSPFFIDSSGQLTSGRGLAVANGTLFIGDTSDVYAVAGSPASVIPLLSGGADDLCASGSTDLLTVKNGTLSRIDTVTTTTTVLTNGFDAAIGCTVDSAGAAYVLEQGDTTVPPRIHKVTGL